MRDATLMSGLRANQPFVPTKKSGEWSRIWRHAIVVLLTRRKTGLYANELETCPGEGCQDKGESGYHRRLSRGVESGAEDRTAIGSWAAKWRNLY